MNFIITTLAWIALAALIGFLIGGCTHPRGLSRKRATDYAQRIESYALDLGLFCAVMTLAGRLFWGFMELIWRLLL